MPARTALAPDKANTSTKRLRAEEPELFVTEDYDAGRAVQVREDDGSWKDATLYRRKDTDTACLWFGKDVYEGLDGSYMMVGGVIFDLDNVEVKTRSNPNRCWPHKQCKRCKLPALVRNYGFCAAHRTPPGKHTREQQGEQPVGVDGVDMDRVASAGGSNSTEPKRAAQLGGDTPPHTQPAAVATGSDEEPLEDWKLAAKRAMEYGAEQERIVEVREAAAVEEGLAPFTTKASFHRALEVYNIQHAPFRSVIGHNEWKCEVCCIRHSFDYYTRRGDHAASARGYINMKRREYITPERKWCETCVARELRRTLGADPGIKMKSRDLLAVKYVSSIVTGGSWSEHLLLESDEDWPEPDTDGWLTPPDLPECRKHVWWEDYRRRTEIELARKERALTEAIAQGGDQGKLGVEYDRESASQTSWGTMLGIPLSINPDHVSSSVDWTDPKVIKEQEKHRHLRGDDGQTPVCVQEAITCTGHTL